MTAILIILELIVAAMVISMIYSVGQMNRDLRHKIADLAQKYAMIEHKAEYLERKIAKLEAQDDE